MGMESVGTQAAQQLVSSFKSSVSEQQRMAQENMAKIKKYTVDKPVGVVKGKALHKAVDKAGAEFAKTPVGKATKEALSKATKGIGKAAAKAAAPVVGAVGKTAEVVGKATKNMGKSAKKMKENIKEAGTIVKCKDENNKDKAPDRSAAIIKSGQDVAKKGIDLGR